MIAAAIISRPKVDKMNGEALLGQGSSSGGGVKESEGKGRGERGGLL